MLNVKEKAKKFWEEHEKEIIVGSVIGVGVLFGVTNYKSYKAGFIDGGMCGFHMTLDWLDKTFPEESKANELYALYRKTHPENIVYQKGLGKWTH